MYQETLLQNVFGSAVLPTHTRKVQTTGYQPNSPLGVFEKKKDTPYVIVNEDYRLSAEPLYEQFVIPYVIAAAKTTVLPSQ